jgi:hypothetical protein
VSLICRSRSRSNNRSVSSSLNSSGIRHLTEFLKLDSHLNKSVPSITV